MRKIDSILLCLVTLLFLNGCKIGKQYTRPELNIPSEMTHHPDSLTLVDENWWEVYADSTLQNLISRALLYNKDVLISTARVKEMAARKRINTANFFPQFDGVIHAERELENRGGDNFRRVDVFEGKVGISWELDLWGKLRWANDAGIADYMTSVASKYALQISIVAEIAQSYFELVALDNELAIVKQTLDARREGVRLAKLRFEGGLTSETSYQQAQVELARTATLVPDLERKIALKENDIAFLAGSYPTRMERSLSLREFFFPDTLPVGIPSDLLERRPDIRQAEQQLIAANARVGVAFTNLFPRLALTGKFGLESVELSNFLQSPYGFMEAILLTPIFAFGKNKSSLKAARAVYEQEGYRYEKTVLNAFKEVSNAIVEYHKTKEIYESRLRLERASKSYVDLAQLQYINGVINYLDVLDAQRGYFDARIGLSNAVRDELIAIVQLYKSLGGGW